MAENVCKECGGEVEVGEVCRFCGAMAEGFENCGTNPINLYWDSGSNRTRIRINPSTGLPMINGNILDVSGKCVGQD